jgi:hypothetical protein
VKRLDPGDDFSALAPYSMAATNTVDGADNPFTLPGSEPVNPQPVQVDDPHIDVGPETSYLKSVNDGSADNLPTLPIVDAHEITDGGPWGHV